MAKLRIGLVGCGTISDVYLRNSKRSATFEMTACADLDHERAVAKAKEYDIPRCLPVAEMYSDPEIDLILNLTTPQSHIEVDRSAATHGKSVYSEKPLAISFSEAESFLQLARSKNVRVGCAPDTFLGARLQTARRLLDDGVIGEPFGASAFMVCHGHESWHPNPAFYYKRGAGPLFDMGPYYVTALVSLLGAIRSVSGYARIVSPSRRITSKPLAGTVIDVEVQTHIAATLEFAQGSIATFVTSFDVWDSQLPRIEIYGTEGTLSIADPDPLAGPNIFGGAILLRRAQDADWNLLPSVLPRRSVRSDWEMIQPQFPYSGDSRGLGLADMVKAIQEGRMHRANGELALHVLEAIEAILRSSETESRMVLRTSCSRPEALSGDTEELLFEDER